MKLSSFLLLLTLQFTGCSAYCQGSLSGVETNGKWSTQVFLSDTYGRPVKPPPSDVNGSPFFTDGFHYADIQLSNGRRFRSIRTRIDLSSQEMHFVSANGVVSFMEAGSVKEIVYADTAATVTTYQFRTGYPSIEGKNEQFFYQVLVNGKAELLRSVEKKITERKEEISGMVSKEYETREEYYLFVKGEIRRLKKERSFLLTALSDQNAALEAYLQTNKSSLRNIADIEKLIRYYNTL